MYSPCDLPSSTRAAPAKNRIWSTIGGISSDIVSDTGLPVFSLSMATSSSAFSSITSASLSSARCRSLGVDHRHVSNAVAGRLEGQVDVLRVGVRRRRVDLARRRVDDVHHARPTQQAWTSPPMMLWKVFFSDMTSLPGNP